VKMLGDIRPFFLFGGKLADKILIKQLFILLAVESNKTTFTAVNRAKSEQTKFVERD
jgi:hypothetical protein